MYPYRTDVPEVLPTAWAKLQAGDVSWEAQVAVATAKAGDVPNQVLCALNLKTELGLRLVEAVNKQQFKTDH